MANVRIYILARELGVQSKILLDRCRDEGISVKSHMSSIPDEFAVKLRRELSGGASIPTPPQAAPSSRPKRIPPIPKQVKKEESKKNIEENKTPLKDAGGASRRKPTRTIKPIETVQRPGELAEKEMKSVRTEVKRSSPRKKQPQQEKSVAAPVQENVQLGSHRSNQINDVQTTNFRRTRRPTRQFQKRGHTHRRQRGTSTLSRELQSESLKGQKFILPTPISVRNLSGELGLKQATIIKDLIKQSVFANINDLLDEDQVLALAVEYEIEIEFKKEENLEEIVVAEAQQDDRPEDMLFRAPIVTFLGHVDHGKTSLLDRILNTDVAAGESGGITQHIAAHSVKVKDAKVVFLDTPGHKAFTAMRARGANVTDIVVLVVAADDGVMPQTQEAIDHAKAAKVPVVVALNKIDRPNAVPDRVLQQLSGLGLQPEEWGGDTIVVRTSAITGDGIDDLLEMLVLQSEILELKANPNKPATGTVLESKLTGERGVEATVLIQDGTLKKGDYIIAGNAFGRVRAIIDDKNHELRSAQPSTPVRVYGFSEAPEASSGFYSVKDLQTAKTIATNRVKKDKESTQIRRRHVTLENLSEHLSSQKIKEALFIVKADVQGSLEVLNKAILDLSGDEIRTRILHYGVGGINESDVLLAGASNAIIVGFHVVPDYRARNIADEQGISIRLYQIIYQAIEEIRAALEGMLEPEEREKNLGHAEVRQIFNVSRFGNIAGCYCKNGVIKRNSRIRLTRGGIIIHEGRLNSLRRVKEDVREVKESLECGMRIEGYDDIKVGDIIESFEIEKIARTLAPIS